MSSGKDKYYNDPSYHSRKAELSTSSPRVTRSNRDSNQQETKDSSAMATKFPRIESPLITGSSATAIKRNSSKEPVQNEDEETTITHKARKLSTIVEESEEILQTEFPLQTGSLETAITRNSTQEPDQKEDNDTSIVDEFETLKTLFTQKKSLKTLITQKRRRRHHDFSSVAISKVGPRQLGRLVN